MSVKALLRRAAWYVVDSLVCMIPRARDANSVLLIRLDNIGDFVLWIHAAEHIVNHYRALGKRVLLVAPTTWATWGDELALFDEVIAVDRARMNSNMLFRWRFLAQIRRRGCDTAILPAYSHDWSSGDAIIRTSGSRQRIASSGDPRYGFAWERRISNRWYTRLLPASDLPMMELTRNAEFASSLLESPVVACSADLTGHALHEVAQQFGISGPYYILFPGASEAMRRWPLENFSTIAQRLHTETGWMGVVCGSAPDLSLAETLCAMPGIPLMNLTGQTSLSALTGLLSTASLLVSNDTASVHIAAALGVPTVAALGGGHPGRFLPYAVGSSPFPILPEPVIHPMECFDCGWWCRFQLGPEDPAPCVARIDVEQVWERTVELLSLSA